MNTIKYPDPILTTPCMPYDFMNAENFFPKNYVLHQVLDEMAIHMKSENGIGLAANQVGIPYRIFVMLDQKGKLWEFINPELSEPEGHIAINEGCLSAPGAIVQVPRAQTITVKAQDRNGEFFTVICQDVEAVCVQHEYDHLQGIFYLEKTSRQQRRQALKALGLKLSPQQRGVSVKLPAGDGTVNES